MDQPEQLGWKAGDHIIYKFADWQESGSPYSGIDPLHCWQLLNIDQFNQAGMLSPIVFYIVRMKLVDTSTSELPRIAEINEQGREIVLTNNTKWYIGWFSGMWSQKWEVGEKILISPNRKLDNKSAQVLINMDHKLETINATLKD